jgi:hypothetical protein
MALLRDEHITYVAGANEGPDLVVRLATPRVDRSYCVNATLSGVASAFAIDIPRAQRAATQFTAITTAPLQEGDAIEFRVFDRPDRRRIPPARLLILDGRRRPPLFRSLELLTAGATVRAPFIVPGGARVVEVEATVQAYSSSDVVQLSAGGDTAVSSGTTLQTLAVSGDFPPVVFFPPKREVAVLSLAQFLDGARVFHVFMTVEFDA